jgi:hypothetical protein
MMIFRGKASSVPDWYPEAYYIQPHYSTMPGYLRVEDAFAPTLTLGQRRFWCKARDRALARWYGLGIDIRVSDVVGGYKADRVTLGVEQIQTGIGGWAAFEYPPCPPGVEGCAWVHVDQDEWEDAWSARYAAPIRNVIVHEFGHSLGFGHGGDGVMAVPRVSNYPNDEEITAAKDYWGIP